MRPTSHVVFIWVVPVVIAIAFSAKNWNNQSPSWALAATSSTFSPTNEDTVSCFETVVITKPFDFVPVLKCKFSHPGIVAYAVPMFADIDGDGETEIVATLDHSPNGFAIIDPHTCEAKYYIETDDAINLKDGGPALGDVDRNGYVDVFCSAGTRIQRWEYDPAVGQMVQRWETPRGVSLAVRPHLDIWDINQDGEAEIIPNQGQMVNGVTGFVYPGTLPELHPEGKGLFAFTADAKLGNAPPGQGNVEVIRGSQIYRYDFTNLNWVLVDELPGLDWGYSSSVSLADMDLDGDVDAVITQWSSLGQAVIWDLQTPTTLGGDVFDFPGKFGSRMNIANMDEDPYPEMVMTSLEKIFAIDDIVTTDGFGNIIWLDETTDESGHTQLTSFDFDGDGSFEIAYRDETNVRIFSGLGDGVPSGGYPSSPEVLLDSGPNTCKSATGLEYPTIGDIDNDQEAEITTTCDGSISIYESGSLPWGFASRVWNTQAFNVTNVNQDGTIPAIPIENYTIYNNFLAQQNLNPEQDTIKRPLPDAVAQVINLTTDCRGQLNFQVEICNEGSTVFPRGIPTAIYVGDPTIENAQLLDTFHLPKTISQGYCDISRSFSIEVTDGSKPLSVVVNDDGQQSRPYVLEKEDDGGIFPVTRQKECNYQNNLDTFSLRDVFAQTLYEEVEICFGGFFNYNGNTYNSPGDYPNTYTSQFGCDSTVILRLKVVENKQVNMDARICNGSTFQFGFNEYSTTGAYRDTTISLETGCDSITTLYLEVLPPQRTTLNISICPGEIYTHNGQPYQAPGTYELNYTDQFGCDSLVILKLASFPENITTLTREICEGEVFVSTLRNYDEPGFYEEVYGDINGCDSVFNLILVVYPIERIDIEASICEGETFDLNGRPLARSGTYYDTLQTVNGCDSITKVTLQVRPNPQTNVTALICPRGSFEFNGTVYDDEGLFEHAFPAQNGCDSLVNLQVIKKPPKVNYVEYEICQGEVFYIGGIAFSEPGVYTGVIPASDGCDSLIQYKLSVFQAYEATFEASICQGEVYYFQGQEYRQSGFYQHAYRTRNGCDSIYNLNLQVNPISINRLDSLICEGDPMVFNDSLLTQSGTYYEVFPNQYGCDSVTILELKVLSAAGLQAQDTILCAGNPVELSVSGGNGRYIWQPNRGLSCYDCPNPIANPTTTTTYTITSLGCKQRPIATTLTVIVVDMPEIALVSDFQSVFGDEIVLTPQLNNHQGEPIEWWINGELKCKDCPTYSLDAEGTNFQVEARIIGEGQCVSSDVVNIDIRTYCIEEDIKIPNVFTPNGDGVNDEFRIETDIQVEVIDLKIFDRWGEQIFYTKSLRNSWDGTFRGQPAEAGVYVYHLRLKCPDTNIFTKTGNVTLLR